jgi:hypothetical protein
MNMYCSTRVVPILCPSPLPYSRNARNLPFFFYSWSNRTIPWSKCHFSTNRAVVIRVIYALPGHFYKYTTQSMTVECQLKLLGHNSHVGTWGHHLQYDPFRTTLKNEVKRVDRHQFYWSGDEHLQQRQRSRDFIVVWELRCKRRVLPRSEDGDLIFLWKKSEILGHNCNSKTRAKLKFSVSFSNSAAWN